jgi:hypothetical protein
MDKLPDYRGLKWVESVMAGEDAKPRSPGSNTGLISSEEQSTQPGRKRKIQDTESRFPDDGQEDDDPGKRPKQKRLGEHLQTLKKFACPFYKHDSQKYMQNPLTGSKFRACAGPGWQTVHRVK